MVSYINKYLNFCKFESNLDEKTIRAYKTDLNQFLYYLEKLKLADKLELIDRSVMKNFISEMGDYSTNTIKRKVASLKAFFNFLEFEEEILESPIRNMRIKLKNESRLPDVLSSLEIQMVLNKCYTEYRENKITKREDILLRDILIIELFINCGLRVSEISGLKVSSFNRGFSSIKILGKGRKHRVIPITHNTLINLLEKYVRLKRQSDFFFYNRNDSMISTESIRRIVKKMTTVLSKKVTPHMFRHSFATLLLEHDMDICFVQQFLGHSNISTTLIYTKISQKKSSEVLSSKNPRNFMVVEDSTV